jgi:hypothetical protein
MECGGNPDLSGATPLWIILQEQSKALSPLRSASALQIARSAGFLIFNFLDSDE